MVLIISSSPNYLARKKLSLAAPSLTLLLSRSLCDVLSVALGIPEVLSKDEVRRPGCNIFFSSSETFHLADSGQPPPHWRLWLQWRSTERRECFQAASAGNPPIQSLTIPIPRVHPRLPLYGVGLTRSSTAQSSDPSLSDIIIF